MLQRNRPMKRKSPFRNKNTWVVDDILIEKEVPRPSRSKGIWQKVVRRMEIGDSFKLDNWRNSHRGVIRNAAISLNMIMTSRKMEDGSIRFWRVK